MSVSKVCVQAERDGDPVAVDLVLPSGTVLAELLPTIVELVGVPPPPDGTVRRWRLQRVCGTHVDESLSLSDNDVRDGELLILDADASPELGPVRYATPQQVAGSTPVAASFDTWLPGAVTVLATTLAAVTLAGTAGSAASITHAVVCAVAAAATLVAAVVTGYPTTSCLGVVALCGATGFLVVPSDPSPPNVFLAAAAALSTALLMLRLSGRRATGLIAAAALSSLVAAVTVAAMPLTVVGAALSTAAIALLAVAPRLSMLAAGLGAENPRGDLAASAASGHAVLGGLVTGSAAGAAAGAVVTAAAGPAGAAVFASLVGTVLVLRARTYVDADRRISLLASGLVVYLAGSWALVSSRPQSVVAVACLWMAVGLVAARRPGRAPVVSRMLDRLEYGALVAVVPVACWVGGAYTALGLS
ncbi:type VII secretion integral membrane protein EccD [Mycolicibacterium sp. P1-18]|uniref:type VII secretion integral membrane protein EccD n=1 Tax=Mycolicibacterium sp. P1-18 TaxID=2024615 RepID=UPI0011F1E3C6|nr:type VII secretion integral membrane protein EccD [Mycolicibacterium sp. P1-18]KAA0098623.1 type VII secretion integral membrane protein EccD [Mycolicibacterium sp. P1-18]